MSEIGISQHEDRDGAGDGVGPSIGRGLERLGGADWRVLLFWLLAGVIGAGVAYRYFFKAFPEASVNFKVTRSAALDQAAAFAAAEGAPLADYKSSVVFNVDDDQKTYLEREVGLEQANRLMASDVNVWYWDARFFRPLQKEEFDVRVDPGGRIVGYSHVLEEAAPGARLDHDTALARAEDFLRNTLHTPLESYTFLPEEANSVARPNRTDWSFTWERTGFLAKDAPYRLSVGLEGDRVGSYEEFLKVPEAWQRSYAKLRSSNDLIETIAILPYALLLGAALSVIIALARGGTINWSAGLKLGLFITALYFLMTINQWPLMKASYDTNSSYTSFWLAQIGSAIASSVALALLVVIAYVPGEPLYRIGQPERLQLGRAFSLPGLRTKEFFISLVIGVCLAGAHIGYVVLFYVTGRHFGVWAPQDLQYSDTLSTALPWLFPLTIGVYAAASEEFLFRMFSIRFLLRRTNSKFVAIVFSAFAWGFLHSNYPQEPAYIRGIEVGLIGIVAGFVMLRWGILATLTWHYSVDAFLTGLSLMRAGDWYSRISGAVVGFGAFIPLIIAGVFYLSRGGFEPATEMINAAAPLKQIPLAEVQPEVAPAVAARYVPLSFSALAGLGVCAVLSAGLLIGVRPAAIGDFVRFSINSRQAVARADDILHERGVDTASYQHAATVQYTFDGVVNEYLRRSIGIAAANKIYREQVPSAFWSVRYFRDSQKEEYNVVLLPDGEEHSVHHTLAESTPGANLSKEDAQAKATAYLILTKGLDLANWKLIQAQSNKLPARTDHSFVWEQFSSLTPTTAGDTEGAHVRVTLTVQGDEVSGYRIRVHVPEDWQRKQEETTLGGTLQGIGQIGLLSVFVIAVLVVFFRNLRRSTLSAVQWRQLALSLLVVLAAAAASFATKWPQYLVGYTTDLPFATFLATRLIGLTLGSLLVYSLTVLLFGLAMLFLTQAYGGEQRVLEWRSMPALYYRDVLWVGVCGCVTLAALPRVGVWLGEHWNVARYAVSASVPQGLDATPHVNSSEAGAVLLGFLAVGILALVLGFAACYLRSTPVQVVLLVVLAVLIAPRAGSVGDFVQGALVGLLEIGLIWWGARRLARSSFVGLVLAGLFATLGAGAVELLSQPSRYFRANGAALAAVIVVLLCWGLAGWLRGTRGEGAVGAAGIGGGGM